MKIINHLRFFWPYISPIKYRYLIAVFIGFPLGLMDGVIPGVLKPLLDALSNNQMPKDIEMIPYMILGVSLIQGMLQYTSTYVNNYVSLVLSETIRRDLYKKLMVLKVDVIHQQKSGYFVAAIYNDPQKAQSVLVSNPAVMTQRISSVVGITTVMLFLNVKLSIVALFVASFLLLPMMLVRSKIIKATKQEYKAIGNVVSLLNDTIASIKIIYSYNLNTIIGGRLGRIHKFLFDKGMKITKAQAILSPISYLVTAVGIALILWMSMGMIAAKEITAGGLVAFVTSLLLLYRPMRNIGDTVVKFQKDQISLDRIREFLERTDWQMPDTSDQPSLPPFKNSIEIKNLTFKYPSRDALVLKNISLTIPHGKVYALVGRSGSGKTTLAELLMGLYPMEQILEGSVLFDGHNLGQLNLVSLRSQIAFVSQDTALFDGSLEENIKMGNPNATTDDLNQAITAAQLDKVIAQLPDGLNTVIGERGVLLSGGQRQRVAIARAFLKNAPILILDEATSALDNESEAAVQKAIDSLMAGRTTIVIAHRLSTIQNADNIVVMDSGSIMEQGNHSQLLAKRGLYYQLATVQDWGLDVEPIAEPVGV